MKVGFLLGTDPGLSGAFTLFNTSTRKIEAIWDMPVVDNRVDSAGVAVIADLAKSMSNGNMIAIIENVSSRPRQAGMWNFALSVGIIHGVLGALGVPFSLVAASEWKPAMGLRRLVNESQAENKKRARLLAAKLWPEKADSFRLAKWDGRAESALIARFFLNKTGL